MGHYLFSFRGRINRAKIWAFFVVIIVFMMVAVGAIATSFGFANIANVIQNKAPATVLTSNSTAFVVCGIVGLLYLAMIWAGFAIAVKRLHDRNKSAWWLIVFYLLPFILNVPRQMTMWQALHSGAMANAIAHGGQMPMGSPLATVASGIATLLSLWAFVELYCLRGTVGDNRYGPDPLAGR